MEISTRSQPQNKQGKSISLEIFSSASFWRRVVPTAPFKEWYFRNLLKTFDIFLTVHPFKTTLFSKRSAHESHPNFLKSLGHRPRPRVILILSNGLKSNSQDHSRTLTSPGVRVSDPGSLGELDKINVHFLWRRVYVLCWYAATEPHFHVEMIEYYPNYCHMDMMEIGRS